MALDSDDVIMRQRLKRAAHQRPAGAEGRAELLLRELHAGRQALPHDRIADAAIDDGGAAALTAPIEVQGRGGIGRREGNHQA